MLSSRLLVLAELDEWLDPLELGLETELLETVLLLSELLDIELAALVVDALLVLCELRDRLDVL